MARPARTNAEYFYHPATFRNDRRVKAIRARYGAAGYGLLLMLLELLTDADNTALATDEMELELLAGDFNVEADEVATLIQAAEKVGLFGRNETGLLKCEQLDIWLAPVFEKRNRSKNAATAAKLPQPATEIGVSVTETQPVEKSTVEYSKGEDNTTSSFQSEVDAPQKKIEVAEVVEPLPESSTTELRTPGGAADVGTQVEGSDKPDISDKPDTPTFTVSKGGRPTEADVLAYLTSQRPHNPPAALAQLATKWHAHYSANGWKVGKNPMKDWQAACRTWLADVPKLEPGQPHQANPQANAVTRSSYGSQPNGAAARLQTPTPDASSSNPWGLPSYTPPASTAGISG